jgi:tetratricopeptide (TPR) repeat protein
MKLRSPLRFALLLAAAGLADVRSQEVPRAIPVEDAPVVPRAIPVEDEPTTPAQPVPPPAPARPKAPGSDLFDYATMIYDRGEFALAAQSFAQYLKAHPNGPDVPMAMFRLAECFLKQNNVRAAETYYLEVVSRFPNSEGAPSAAYRLGAMRFNAQDFDDAARHFAFCAAKSPLPQVRLAAAFNESRAYQQVGNRRKQTEALRQVVAAKEDNPYRENALLALGSAYLAEDRKAEALPLFLELIETGKDNPMLSEACVKAAVLLAETGKPDEALPLFERALKIAETTSVNRGIALVGVVQSLYAKGDYEGVIGHYARYSDVLPEGDTRARMLLLVGNAYRMKKSYARAVEVYLMIEQGFPGSIQALEAGYWRLYCFYLLDDKQLGDFANAFIARHAEEHGDHEFLNLARLIRADFYFNQGDYARAADSFAEVRVSGLPDKLRPGALFNKAWSCAEARRHQEAIAAFAQFLAENPGHPFTAKALARRGMAYKDAREVAKAVADFQRVVKEFTHSDAAEVSYLQLGLIAGDQRDSKAMIAAFEMLVNKYPNSAAAAQAWYGIGRGYFEQKQFDKAVPALEKAIEKDRENYLDRASPMILLSHYARQDVEALAKAIDAYRKANASAAVPLNTLTWLGLKLYDQGDFKRSASYLKLAATPELPDNTDPRVWNYLGMAQLEAGEYEESLQATGHYLAVTPESGNRARALVTKGRALLGLGRIEEAQKTAEEGLGFAKDGKPQALLLILEGDILMAAGDKLAKAGNTTEAKEKYNAAAGKLMIPAQFFDDAEVTPEALDKAANALDKAGQTAKAGDFRKMLRERYPQWQAKQ